MILTSNEIMRVEGSPPKAYSKEGNLSVLGIKSYWYPMETFSFSQSEELEES